MSDEPSELQELEERRLNEIIRTGVPYEVWSLVSRQSNSLLSTPSAGGAILANGVTGNPTCAIHGQKTLRNDEIWFNFVFKANDPANFAITAQGVNQPVVAQALNENDDNQLFRLKKYNGFGVFESFTFNGSFLAVNELTDNAQVTLKPMKRVHFPNPQTLFLFHEMQN